MKELAQGYNRRSEPKSYAQKLLSVLKSHIITESVIHVHVCWGAMIALCQIWQVVSSYSEVGTEAL